MALPALDFREIPEANLPGAKRDAFELFAREFLAFMGYTIVTGPDRGADGGRDLIVEESRGGVGGETRIRWLVSCKHYAHSGRSVSPSDEPNIRDRVEANGCQGFIGFYSTVPSSGLARVLEGLRDKLEVQVFDSGRIERYLLSSPRGAALAQRYFPRSYHIWCVNNQGPSKIYAEDPSLKCAYCGRELLDRKGEGIIVWWKRIDSEPTHVEALYWCCKGYCDRVLSTKYRDKHLVDSWEDIADATIPLIFIRWVIGTINELRSGVTYTDEAFRNLKDLILNVFPYAARQTTEEEEAYIQSLMDIPTYFGGLGQ